MPEKKSFVKPLGRVNLDKGPAPGDHLWVVKNAILSAGGYEQMPELEASFTFGPGQAPLGAHYWQGGNDPRSYIALTNTIWELSSGGTATDVTGVSVTNATNGVTFTSYGEFCFAANGVDAIQSIRVPASTGSTTVNFLAMDYTDGGAQIAPKYIASHKNHLVAANASMLASYNQLGTYTTGNGAAFTNQPAGDSVQVLSLVNSANTRSRTATIYGTRVGQGDTVSFEVIALDAANSTTPVTTTITNWALILGVKIDAIADQIIRFRETSGAATIADIGVGNVLNGVEQPSPAIPAGGQVVIMVASGATTRQIGLSASDWSGGVIYDSQALTGTTSVKSNERLNNVLEVFTGDLEATRTVTITTFEFAIGSEHPYAIWISATDVPESWGKISTNPTFTGVEQLQLYDGQGKITGVIDGGDSLYVFKEGSIYKIDGPPFVPTVISYSVGKPAGTGTYRQAGRIYFWATNGLHYIDTATNEVVNLFDGRMLRAVTDYANVNFGLVTGTYPEIETLLGSLQQENVVCTGDTVHISGDSRYGYVIMSFENSSLGGGMLLYQSKEDCFVIPGNPGGYNGMVWETPQTQTGTPFPMSSIRVVSDTGASNTVSKWNLTSLWGRTTAYLPYFVFPFDRFVGRDSIGRIIRVRPVFDDTRKTSITDPYFGSSDVRVISDSVNNRNWTRQTVTLADSYSKDGWFNFSKCPWASGHAIVIMINEETGQNSQIGSFATIEVELEVAPGRGQ